MCTKHSGASVSMVTTQLILCRLYIKIFSISQTEIKQSLSGKTVVNRPILGAVMAKYLRGPFLITVYFKMGIGTVNDETQEYYTSKLSVL